MGCPKSSKTLPPQRLVDFYQRWYRPDLMAVIAVGDFDTELIEAKVRQYFAPPPEGEAGQAGAAVGPPTDRPRYGVPEHDEPRVNVFSDPEAPARRCSWCESSRPSRATTWRRCDASWWSGWRS